MTVLLTIAISVLAGCGVDGESGISANAGNAPTSYSVSGNIVANGIPLAGVTVNTTGGSVLTDSNGKYVISGLSNGTYIVTPVKTAIHLFQ